jgi:diacylglycerol kinase family enzyme
MEVAFALGGDGTLREAAKGLLGSDVALGPLPAGTANVLAYAFDLPRTPIAAARALAEGEIRTMDVGLANGEPFLMMVSAGLDAAVMAKQSPKWKRLFGPAAIVGSGLGQWWTYDYPEIGVRVDGQTLEGSFVALCNIPHYGGPYRLAPEARIDDGLLDLVCFQGRGALPSLGFGLSMMRGRLGGHPDIRTAQVREAEILGPLPHGLQIDGDVIQLEPPITVGVGAGSLRVLSPR